MFPRRLHRDYSMRYQLDCEKSFGDRDHGRVSDLRRVSPPWEAAPGLSQGAIRQSIQPGPVDLCGRSRNLRVQHALSMFLKCKSWTNCGGTGCASATCRTSSAARRPTSSSR
jgi:hypothetical protein